MMIKHRGVEPRLDESVYIAPTAVICGNVTLGARARVMFGAVINSEASSTEIHQDGYEKMIRQRIQPPDVTL